MMVRPYLGTLVMAGICLAAAGSSAASLTNRASTTGSEDKRVMVAPADSGKHAIFRRSRRRA